MDEATLRLYTKSLVYKVRLGLELHVYHVRNSALCTHFRGQILLVARKKMGLALAVLGSGCMAFAIGYSLVQTHPEHEQQRTQEMAANVTIV
jgi:hypothetical protein